MKRVEVLGAVAYLYLTSSFLTPKVTSNQYLKLSSQGGGKKSPTSNSICNIFIRKYTTTTTSNARAKTQLQNEETVVRQVVTVVL